MQSIISTFHIDWKIIIAQAINFGIVFIVLYMYALKPLSKLMKERSEKIGKGVEDAKVNAEVLEKTQKEYEEIIAKGKREATNAAQENKKALEAKKVEMMEAAKNEVAAFIASGKKSLEAEKVKMVADAKKEIASLVIQSVEKVIGEQVDAKFEAKVMKDLSKMQY